MLEDQFLAWNQDQSYDNLYFGNLILEQGTLARSTNKRKRKYPKVSFPSKLSPRIHYSDNVSNSNLI